MELTAKDLRIGNYVVQKGSNFAEEVTLELLCRKDVVLEPIQLNEKWLEQLGLSLQEGYIGYYSIGKIHISVEGQVYVGVEETWLCEIHFVHQLQNLFYSICGEEL